MSVRILLLGNGGREHALAWKLAQSPSLDRIYVCPGNGGTANVPKTVNLNLPLSEFQGLVEFAVKNEIDLVVPGPEQPLVDGIESYFRKVGIPVFGPSALAARLEGSKAFSKAFMARHGIPTATFRVFKRAEIEKAIDYVSSCEHRVVLKASGLAGGKGVLIPSNTEDAIASLKEMIVDNIFGDAANEIVIEEFLSGPEVSVLAFCDGYTIVPLPAAQDHKRIGDGDVGLNTGGMGAYAPASVGTPAIIDQIVKETLRPTIDGMRREGFPFVGMLFTGLMLTSSGPKVLEYNVRFGDPETEALMLLLGEEVDLVAVMLACVRHHLDSTTITFRPGFAVSVVLASLGYPGAYNKGKLIEFKPLPQNVVAFHAGTTLHGDRVVTSGGRVLAITAYAPTIHEALDAAYAGVDAVSFEGKTFRRDIGHRALTPLSDSANVLTYAQAGVSVDAGNRLVELIKPYVRSTRRPGTDAEIGGFGGTFDLKAIGHYKDPILVSGTDGVGTKLRVAIAVGIHDSVGIDLVAMSVNDLLVQGAEPLFFLDYFACSKLDTEVASQVVKGIADGCRQAGCALIGGETAEMPGMYKEGDYDLAGFSVGAVERELFLPSKNIAVGDVLIGISSSGLHSNGFSLVRKVISVCGFDYHSQCPWSPGTTLGRALLEPTRIYVSQILPAARAGLLKGLSHITGGGFIDNIPRVLPSGLGCSVDVSSWVLPPVFRFLMQHGKIEPLEMARAFNNGIGMIVIVGSEEVDKVLSVLGKEESQAFRIGEVVAKPGVELKNLHTWSI